MRLEDAIISVAPDPLERLLLMEIARRDLEPRPRRMKTYPPSVLIQVDYAEVARRKRTAEAEAAYQAMLRGQRRRNRRGRASLLKRRTA
jgi:hypothetical protein